MTIARVVRRATAHDIVDMMTLRLSVRENRLSHPDQVTAADCLPYVQLPARAELFYRAAGWRAPRIRLEFSTMQRG